MIKGSLFVRISQLLLILAGVCSGLHIAINLSWWVLVALTLFYISFLVLGAIYIQWNVYLPSYNKGRDLKQLVLTFDDGPATETVAILDILKQQNVPATFFVIGKNIAANIELLKRADAEGHAIGNHSFNHGFNFDWQSVVNMREEIEETNAAVSNAIGKTPKLFRPPYGVTNPNLAKAVENTKMQSIGWSVRSFDTKAKDPKELLQSILGKIKGSDIILLHDRVAITTEILTDLIITARQKGFTFVRVDEMLHIEAYA